MASAEAALEDARREHGEALIKAQREREKRVAGAAEQLKGQQATVAGAGGARPAAGER